MRGWDWLAILLGAAAIVGTGVFLAAPALAQGIVCTQTESMLARDRDRGIPSLVLSGWRGERLARKHAEWTGFRPDSPVNTVIVQILPDPAIAVWAQQGELACAPAKLSPSEWRGVVLDLIGQRV